jgi:hypothetical protein
MEFTRKSTYKASNYLPTLDIGTLLDCKVRPYGIFANDTTGRTWFVSPKNEAEFSGMDKVVGTYRAKVIGKETVEILYKI